MYRKYKILSFVLIICMYTTLTAGDGLRTPKIDFKNKIQEILTSEKIVIVLNFVKHICNFQRR